jgi:hypothetical protein
MLLAEINKNYKIFIPIRIHGIHLKLLNTHMQSINYLNFTRTSAIK